MALSPDPPADDAAPEVAFEVLPNGLSLLLREVRVAPVAEVQIWAGVGSADERPGEEGLAHFHEHMLFKGTERRGVGEIAAAVEGVGGRLNAFTSFDVTCYHATVPAGEVETAVDVLSDAVRHSVFDPEEVAREVDVVLEEIARSDDDPVSVLSDAVFAAAYRIHPYRAPILGTRESVASFTREKVEAFYRRWYRPENLLVVVVGDVDAARVREAVRAAFADAERGGQPRSRPAEPTQRELRPLLLRRPFERACADLSWKTVSFAHPDAPLLDLLAFVLGQGESSRLVQRVKEEFGLADEIEAASYTPLDPGLFAVSADCEAEKLGPLVEAVLRETEILRAERVSEEELEKARANFLASRHFEMESVSGMARKLASFQIVAGDWRREAAYLERIREATPEDLRRVARDWLDPGSLTAGGLLPEAACPQMDEAALAEAVRRGVAEASRAFLKPRPRARTSDVHTYALENGATLHVVPRRAVPVVSLRAAMLGGQLFETAETAGLSQLLAGVWLRGTRAHAAADFARRVEALAADVDSFSGRSSIGVTLDATREKLLPALDLFAEVLLAPAFAAEEVERERRDTLAHLARREDRLAARTFDLFAATLFERHPYGRPLLGTPETVRAATGEALAAHHARLVRPDNLVVAAVGDVEPDAMAASLSRRLGPLAGAPFEAALPEEEPAPEAIRTAELEKARAQAHLVIGFRGLTVRDPDREALEVLTQILGGQGGRLFVELRDRRGLAYTVTALNVEGVAPGFLAAYIGTAPERREEARRGILEELERAVQAPPEEAELLAAQRYLVGNFAIDQQRAHARALHVALDARYGLGADADRRYAERIRAVTRDDVLRVARRVIDLDAYTLATIHP